MPVREGRDTAGEVLRGRLLVAGEQAEREGARVSQQLVHGRLLAHGDADQRRVERERDDGSDREPELLAAGVHGEDRHPGRKAAEERAQLVGDVGQLRGSTSEPLD